MLYSFLQVLVRLVLRVYFRKIFISDAHLIPPDKPVILACNHPNSFLDAVLLAILLKKPIHFLARSDVFNSPFKNWLLSKLHLIPIYRLEEGAENLHKNQDTFARCYDLLRANGQVLIFSEGTCVNEKHLRPLRKGTARLAFGAEEAQNFNLDLQIVLVGINYTYPQQFRSEVMIGVAEPIPIKAYREQYKTNPARAITQLNKQIYAGLHENIVIIEDTRAEQEVEKQLARNRLYLPDFYKGPWLSRSRSLLETEKKIAHYISGDTDASGTCLNQKYTFDEGKAKLVKSNIFWLILGFPVFIFGYLLNIVPLWLAQYITRKKVRVIEFYASVLMVLGMVCYLLYWLLLVFCFVSGWGISGFGFVFLIPVLGFAALHWWDEYRLYQKLAHIK